MSIQNLRHVFWVNSWFVVTWHPILRNTAELNNVLQIRKFLKVITTIRAFVIHPRTSWMYDLKVFIHYQLPKIRIHNTFQSLIGFPGLCKSNKKMPLLSWLCSLSCQLHVKSTCQIVSRWWIVDFRDWACSSCNRMIYIFHSLSQR